MPKRAPTPPIDDGAKYLTVVHPYPARPNMEFDAHRKLLALWVAACIGPRYLRALYHKPTSPGSVILEIDESLPDFKRILGAHKWSEFLKELPRDAEGQVTKVFYSTFNSDRVVQKNGWKRIDISDSWFLNQSKVASKFVSPYPPTSWCDVPDMPNVIQSNLCRPLPGASFPRPPPSRPTPVVGTPEWQEWKRAQNAPPAPVWSKGISVDALKNAKGSNTPIGRAPSRQNTPSYLSIATTPEPLSPSGGPPGLARAASYNSTGSSGPISPLDPPLSSWNSSPAASSPIDDVPVGHVIVGGISIERALASVGLNDTVDDEDDDMYFSVTSIAGDAEAPALVSVPQTDYSAKPLEVQESLWGGYVDDGSSSDYEDDDKTLAKAARKNPVLCREHNVVCSKGICKIYAAQLRDKKRQEREEERQKEREEYQARKKNSFFKDPPTSRPRVHAPPPPPHLRPGAAPPPPSVPRQLPAHLKRGAAPAISPTPSNGPPRITQVPSCSGTDDARSTSSGSSTYSDKLKPPPAINSSSSASAHSDAGAPPPPAPRAWGAWGKAPSISASSVARNNESWSAAVRDDPDFPAFINDDARSVTSGWGSVSDGPWGSSAAVRAVSAKVSAASAAVEGDGWATASKAKSSKKGKGKKNKGESKTWAEQMDELDAQSNAPSTLSDATWGNVSVGPW